MQRAATAHVTRYCDNIRLEIANTTGLFSAMSRHHLSSCRPLPSAPRVRRQQVRVLPFPSRAASFSFPAFFMFSSYAVTPCRHAVLQCDDIDITYYSSPSSSTYSSRLPSSLPIERSPRLISRRLRSTAGCLRHVGNNVAAFPLGADITSMIAFPSSPMPLPSS